MKDVRKTAILSVSAIVFVEHWFLLWSAGKMRRILSDLIGEESGDFALPYPTELLLSKSWIVIVTAVLLAGWTIWTLFKRDPSPRSDRVFLVTMAALSVFLYLFSLFVYLLPFCVGLIVELE